MHTGFEHEHSNAHLSWHSGNAPLELHTCGRYSEHVHRSRQSTTQFSVISIWALDSSVGVCTSRVLSAAKMGARAPATASHSDLVTGIYVSARFASVASLTARVSPFHGVRTNG